MPFIDFNTTVDEITLYCCPHCRSLYKTEEDAVACSKDEERWQKRWLKSKAGYVRLLSNDGLDETYMICRIHRVTMGDKCGKLLNIHASRVKANPNEADEIDLCAVSNINMCFPATEKEYNDYMSLGPDMHRELLRKEYFHKNRRAWRLFSESVKNINEQSLIDTISTSSLFKTEPEISEDPWGDFESVSVE